MQFGEVTADVRIHRDDVPGREDQVIKVWERRLDDGVEEIDFDLRRYRVESLAFDGVGDCFETDSLAFVGGVFEDCAALAGGRI